ncbi:hypothetical protein OOK31_39235 [Streptomyces sp. NBC_00249]|nr:hypothetical protein [Streptomyces sp. NBC_00249]MCX5199429.1 hypothetical protein [Streptomyces sp. NBC_00249]MCX5199743.1 hypothetical protein [Streptomyces sp. NBC_00249]MCX5199840.1 hypothetical protein [Streptomyces sp. NBC_00249]
MTGTSTLVIAREPIPAGPFVARRYSVLVCTTLTDTAAADFTLITSSR